MKKKTILITGASSGVGMAIADYLSVNHTVIAIARRLDKMLEHFNGNNNVRCYSFDLNKLSEIPLFLNRIEADFEDIEYIINCSGIMKAGLIEKLSYRDYEESINVNAFAPIEIVKYFLPKFKKNNFGRIVNFTSGAPLNCFSNYSIYSVSKGMLNHLSCTLAKEIKDYNITINLMSPGPVKSEMAPNALLEPNICFPTLDYLLNKGNESGRFYWLGYEVPLFPELGNVDWLNGIGSDRMNKIDL